MVSTFFVQTCAPYPYLIRFSFFLAQDALRILKCRKGREGAQPEEAPAAACTPIQGSCFGFLVQVNCNCPNCSLHPSKVGELVPDLAGSDRTLSCLLAGYRKSSYRPDKDKG